MALTKVKGQHLVKHRNKAYEQYQFNLNYIDVAAEEFNLKTQKMLRKREYAAKKRLFPLEIAATDPSVRAPELQEQEIAAFIKKQELPRRAVQQTYLRKVKKHGEAAANAYRDKALKKLDDALEAYEARVKAKYPLNAPKPAPANIQKYQDSRQAELRKLEQFKADRAEKCQEMLAGLRSKLDRENESKRKAYTEANQELARISAGRQIEMEPSSILSLRGVKMYFSGVKAVDDVSFDVKEGEIFGLIGPNGAGKSTLFNCITQFYRPTGGQVFYRDRHGIPVDLTDYTVHDIVKTGIARTFQNLELILNITVLDNLLVGAHSRFRGNLFDQFFHTKKMRNEEAVNKARALEVLEHLGLMEYRNRIPAGLPYGILKRIELARTLMTNPRMIILDEPAAGLNDVETEELAQVIRKIRDDYKCTIFLVEHDMNLVMGICETICAISFGKMLGIGTPKEIQANRAVQTAYLGVDEEEEE